MLNKKELLHKGVPYFEDAPCYSATQLSELFLLSRALRDQPEDADTPRKMERFQALMDEMDRTKQQKEKVYLWPAGNMPVNSDYTDNSSLRYNHDPDFLPFLYEMLLPEDVTPRGAIVLCAGGDHGDSVAHEGYQVALEMLALGYQCILLLNRPNSCPYSRQECGADAARAIRYVRANAARLRVRPDQVAFAGFSNGGLTGEACIEFYSGTKTVKDHFPDYVEDALDKYYGAPDAFLCVYGPRRVGEPFSYDGVVYPPAFFAVGMDDKALDNLHAVYPDLLAHGVQAEVHTFLGVPHGQAGIELFHDERYANFGMWVPLADHFMQQIWAANAAG